MYTSTRDTRRRSRSTVTTHHIGSWTIQESFEPLRQKENHSDIHQWNVSSSWQSNDYPKIVSIQIAKVCSFVEHVLHDDRYRSIIEEHLIDGLALVLLKDEHLINVFHMPSKERHRLLQQIKQIQI